MKLSKKPVIFLFLITFLVGLTSIQAQYEDPFLDEEIESELDETLSIDQNDEPTTKASSKMYKYEYHPDSAKGLYKIKADGSYVYKVGTKSKTGGFAFKGGSYFPKKLQNSKTNVSFEDIYGDEGNILVFLERDWVPIKKRKNLSLNFATGVTFADGKAVFKADQTESPEELRMYLLPNSLGLKYTFKYWDSQLLVPYFMAGAYYFTFVELRDEDSDKSKFGGSFGTFYTPGLMVNLGYFDISSKLELDREYGITDVYLSLEMRNLISNDEELDFSGDFFLMGLNFNF